MRDDARNVRKSEEGRKKLRNIRKWRQKREERPITSIFSDIVKDVRVKKVVC